MGIQTAKVMTERVGGGYGKPALKVVPEPKPPEPSALLREAVVGRLRRDTTEFLGGLTRFLDNPVRAGIASVGLVLSPSSLALDFWKEPRTSPEARAQLARTLALAADVDEATLVGALLSHVYEAFGEFEESAAGREFREAYDALLQRCEMLGVAVILLGHDVGPMASELHRLDVSGDHFCRSLLLDSRVLAVVPPSPELCEDQVLVSGVSVSQLGTLVTQMRQLNPLLTNRQVRNFLVRTLREGTQRKSLGREEAEQLHDWSRQILRLQAVERLAC